MANDLFFELLRISLGQQERLSRQPSDDEWFGLFRESARQAVLGVTYRALSLIPQEQCPPRKLFIDWQASVQKLIIDNKRLNHDSIWVSGRFLKAGFRSAILKGQGNALLYPDPFLRTSGDIDIWLDGSPDSIISYVTRLFPKTRVQRQEVEFPVRKDTCIEVHTIPALMFNPSDRHRMEAYFHEHSEEIFSNEVELPGEEGKVCIPTLRVNLTFQLIHIYRHIFNEGIGLRQLIDYFYLLRHCRAEAQTDLLRETAEMVGRLHMKRFVAGLMWVMKEVFRLEEDLLILPADEHEGRFLLSEIMLAGNFGQFDKRNKLKATKWGNFWQQTFRNLRFLTHYPREVIWNPWYRVSQFLWKKRNGYC